MTAFALFHLAILTKSSTRSVTTMHFLKGSMHVVEGVPLQNPKPYRHGRNTALLRPSSCPLTARHFSRYLRERRWRCVCVVESRSIEQSGLHHHHHHHHDVAQYISFPSYLTPPHLYKGAWLKLTVINTFPSYRSHYPSHRVLACALSLIPTLVYTVKRQLFWQLTEADLWKCYTSTRRRVDE